MPMVGRRLHPPSPTNYSRSVCQVPTTPPFLRLVAITAENVRAVCDLSVSAEQERFVASTAVSLAEAGVYPQAWCRAIEVPGVGLVGFVMLHDTTEEPGYMLWRLLVDRRFQGRGYGGAAVRSVAEYVRGRPGAVDLKVGARRGAGSPRAFYESLGFSPNGEIIGDEDVLVVDLENI
jgi:diamine N-acetyltransferase